jgi:phosphonate transport system substrate-binding protein
MRTLIASLLLVFTPQLAGFSFADKNVAKQTELRLGVFPRRSAKATKSIFLPLSQVIAKQLNIKVKLETTHDFASFWANVANNKYDLVHYNQYHYVKSHKQFGYRVIAQNVEFGHQSIAGAILVRKDSGINSAKDLKGKTIVFGGGHGAMQAYISATYLLRMAGLKKGDYFEQFALNPPKACIATYYRKAAAAGAGNYVLELPQVQNQINTDEMKYLMTGELTSHLPWAVKRSISHVLEKKLQSILINLDSTESGRAVLKSAKITRFLPATDRDYDLNREIIRAVTKEEY